MTGHLIDVFLPRALVFIVMFVACGRYFEVGWMLLLRFCMPETCLNLETLLL
jgi:hypothetical protein